MSFPVKRLAIYGLLILLVSCCKRADSDADADDSGYSDSVFASEMTDTIVAEDTVPAKMPILKDTDSILEAMMTSPDKEKYEKGILPIMAKEVPEYAGKLLANEEEGFLIVDKNTMRIYRYDKYGVEQERVGIAVAKNFGSKHKKRDGRTPEGFFSIEGIYDSTDWLFTDDDGNTSPTKGQFGPRYMRLRTPVSSQIGIHGTVAPWSIGGRRSHGCIRMLNENIVRFAEICKPGWPVIVSPGPKDMAINESEGYNIPSVTVIPGRPRCKPGKYAPPTEETNPSATAATDSLKSNGGTEVDSIKVKGNEIVHPADPTSTSGSETTPLSESAEQHQSAE